MFKEFLNKFTIKKNFFIDNVAHDTKTKKIKKLEHDTKKLKQKKEEVFAKIDFNLSCTKLLAKRLILNDRI